MQEAIMDYDANLSGLYLWSPSNPQGKGNPGLEDEILSGFSWQNPSSQSVNFPVHDSAFESPIRQP